MKELINSLFKQVKENPVLKDNCHIITAFIDSELVKSNYQSEAIVGKLWIKDFKAKRDITHLLKENGNGHAWNKVTINGETYILDIAIFHQSSLDIKSSAPIFVPYKIDDKGRINIEIKNTSGKVTHTVTYQDSNISNNQFFYSS